ncbi:hypothetical protein [Streptomyces sp. NPDC048277]|uniref:hypothetical protein n=1 Tax=Streptomyces sp. NPDC048277 TaxID=3155027 RepID=UPI0033DCDEB2
MGCQERKARRTHVERRIRAVGRRLADVTVRLDDDVDAQLSAYCVIPGARPA